MSPISSHFKPILSHFSFFIFVLTSWPPATYTDNRYFCIGSNKSFTDESTDCFFENFVKTVYFLLPFSPVHVSCHQKSGVFSDDFACQFSFPPKFRQPNRKKKYINLHAQNWRRCSALFRPVCCLTSFVTTCWEAEPGRQTLKKTLKLKQSIKNKLNLDLLTDN